MELKNYFFSKLKSLASTWISLLNFILFNRLFTFVTILSGALSKFSGNLETKLSKLFYFIFLSIKWNLKKIYFSPRSISDLLSWAIFFWFAVPNL